MYKFDAVINNEFIKTESQLEIINPDGLLVAGTVAALNAEQINQAFQAARAAQKAWESESLLKRISILKKWSNLLLEQKEALAQIIMAEVGKSHSDAVNEVMRSVEYMDATFEEAKRMQPLSLTGQDFGVANKLGTFEHVAKGVGLAISPFNFPINLAMSKIAPALVMGNTLVFKPATAGSLTGSMLGKLAVEAGLPAGVFNVVTGRGREIGDLITQNKEINFINFTGSVDIGHRILDIATSKDIVLELGGKDPALVMDDSDLEKYASEIIVGAFSYSGQRCTAVKRVITTNAIADKLVPILADKIKKLKVGSPKDNAFITPVIDMKSADFIWELIQDSKKDGAKVITGDKREANLIYPTLVDFVTTKMRLAWEEPFGPVLPIIRIDDLQQSIEVINKSNFGLQASIYTKDIAQAIHLAKKIEVGTVNINGKSQRGPDSFPFLGVKDSGQGVQGIHEALLSVTRYKGIVINY
ncbi:glyceraldehyde-3-phosphate dehydrogenase [Williamsoniiplasma somnilux]|uniref:Glyceraldehyde-3-phosphate dehydrogenase n=1 Tax=Williamsoniiplasma somnilux TaxID=215578 RepID=A0A2K8NYL7_9MOLU|nr:NADP-dependent glyceraldehyde-3-phosphate dehydrogenase [Williamsoniiplasma somnilux]ATZ18646.1 glyceraldehyde-3-phosphate dehydrogenase [Williamsoniiplasma somnilux]